VKLLCRSAGNGDLQAARALIPWINQALGMPTERVEHRVPQSLRELEELSTEQLAVLVEKGRRRRLESLPPSPEQGRQARLGVVD
jgi:hypothetical protein